jgi:hypothetical protein
MRCQAMIGAGLSSSAKRVDGETAVSKINSDKQKISNTTDFFQSQREARRKSKRTDGERVNWGAGVGEGRGKDSEDKAGLGEYPGSGQWRLAGTSRGPISQAE